jgi:heme/copper-type cytochrome/quinol oxidase subunit 1
MIVGVIVPALFAGIGHVFVVEAMRVQTLSSAYLGWLAWIVWVCGCAALLTLTLIGPEWAAYAPGPAATMLVFGVLAIAASLLLTGIHFIVVFVNGYASAGTPARLAAFAFVLPLLVLAFAMATGPMLGGVAAVGPLLGCTLVAALALAYHLVARRDGWVPAPVVVALALAAILVGAFFTSGLTSFVALVGKLVLVPVFARAILRGSARTSAPMLYLGLGVAPALGISALSTGLLENLSVDVHLHDTYFVLGGAHLVGGIVLFTSLAAIHAWSDELLGRSYRPHVARIACVLVCGGTIAMAVLMLALGHNGMPRRYQSYIDAFAPQHRAATIAALATALGYALVLVGLFTSAKRSR